MKLADKILLKVGNNEGLEKNSKKIFSISNSIEESILSASDKTKKLSKVVTSGFDKRAADKVLDALDSALDQLTDIIIGHDPETNEGLGLDVKTKGTKIIFKNANDKKKAIKKLSGEGMRGLENNKSASDKELEFTDVETVEQVLDILEAKGDGEKLSKMLNTLGAELVASNKKKVLLWFKEDSEWILYKNEISKSKNIPGTPLIKISTIDAQPSEVEALVRGMVK